MRIIPGPRVARAIVPAVLAAAAIGLAACMTGESSAKGPAITAHPADTVTAGYGAKATLVMAASGSGALSYAWVKGASDTVGRKDTLTLAKVRLADTGSYKCVVRDANGMVVSSAVNLRVAMPGKSQATYADSYSVTVTGTTSGTIVTQNLYFSCDTGSGRLDTPFIDTVPSTAYFAVTGGSLYLWYDSSDCYAERLNGSSSTVFGTWTDPIIGVEEQIPTAFRNPECTNEADPLNSGNLGFTSGTYTYTVGASTRQTLYAGEACGAKDLAALYTDSANGVVIASSSCSSVELRNGESGETALFSSKLTNAGKSLYFQSEGKTCSVFYPIPTHGVAPNCQDANPDEDTYFNCVNESALYASSAAKPGVSLAKKYGRGAGRFHPASSGGSRGR